MRLLLIPILVLAAAGAAWFALRDRSAQNTSGAGPATASGPAEGAQASLDLADLARGDATKPARASAAEPEAPAAAPEREPTAAEFAAAAGINPHVPEPSLESGSTDQPVGAVAVDEFELALAAKYRDAGRAQRAQSAQALRTTLELQRNSTDKDVQRDYESLKSELVWLEAHLDG